MTVESDTATANARAVRWRSQAALDNYNNGTVWLWLALSLVFLGILALQLVGPAPWQPWLTG